MSFFRLLLDRRRLRAELRGAAWRLVERLLPGHRRNASGNNMSQR